MLKSHERTDPRENQAGHCYDHTSLSYRLGGEDAFPFSGLSLQVQLELSKFLIDQSPQSQEVEPESDLPAQRMCKTAGGKIHKKHLLKCKN